MSSDYTANNIFHPVGDLTPTDLVSTGTAGVVYDDSTDIIITNDAQDIPNIYTSDGQLTGNRQLDGNGNTLIFNNLDDATINANNDNNIVAGGDAFLTGGNRVVLGGQFFLADPTPLDNTQTRLLVELGTGEIRHRDVSSLPNGYAEGYAGGLSANIDCSVAASPIRLVFDTAGPADYDAGGYNNTTGEYTVATGGRYEVSVNISFSDAAATANQIALRVYVDASNVQTAYIDYPSTTSNVRSATISRVFNLAGGNVVYAEATYTAGSGLILAAEQSSISIQRLL